MTREEAINKVRQMSLPEETMEILQALAPELVESEDERIRKFLVKHISEWIGCIEHDLKITPKDVESEEELAMFKAGLAYLEKQKEQRGKIERAPQGDVVTMLLSDTNTSKSDSILSGRADQKPYELKNWPADKENLSQEQKPAEKHDLVTQLKEHFANTPKEQLEAEWKELEHWNNIGPTVEEYFHRIKPAEWSEEDEKIFNVFLHKVEVCNLLTNEENVWIIKKLKSLRPQYHGDVTMTEAYKMGLEAGKASSWKPSEEDLMMLEHIIGQYETGNKNSKVMGYLPRIEELDFLKKVFAIWKS